MLRQDAADDFILENPADALTAREATVRTFAYLLIAVASVSLMVGGISIMNVMLVSVTERTREIGLRMAVGAQRHDIRRQFLTEAVALALAGGFLGVIAGCIGATIIAWQAGWPVLISPDAIFLSCVFAGLVGITFGVLPRTPRVPTRSNHGPALRIGPGSGIIPNGGSRFDTNPPVTGPLAHEEQQERFDLTVTKSRVTCAKLRAVSRVTRIDFSADFVTCCTKIDRRREAFTIRHTLR